jgi:hypothetical protein
MKLGPTVCADRSRVAEAGIAVTSLATPFTMAINAMSAPVLLPLGSCCTNPSTSITHFQGTDQRSLSQTIS